MTKEDLQKEIEHKWKMLSMSHEDISRSDIEEIYDIMSKLITLL